MEKMWPKVVYCHDIFEEKLRRTAKIVSPYGLCPSCLKSVTLEGSAALHRLLGFVWICGCVFLELGWPSSMRFCGYGFSRTGVAIFY
jgi:hypothetical protein